ncbi:MAG: zinc ribbon domain-containing protein [Candidatus Woesearchaeota archaeon]|nr:zinc ribbon domain-containing protein [Candidatus Woesearchaeota archaeon]
MSSEFCPLCNKKLRNNSKFCNHCGRKIVKDEHMRIESNKNLVVGNIIASVFVGIILIGATTIFLTYLNQRNSETNDSNSDLLLPEDRLLDISQQIQTIKNYEEKRKEGYTLNEKPFVSGNYEYDERTVDFRLVCKNPCPVSKDILDQEFAAIAYAVSSTRGLTQSDIDKDLLPFEVHASDDGVCPYLSGAAAYMSSFIDQNGYQRGRLCFFYDKINYNRDKFPYSTSVHEVMHLFEYNKVPYGGGKGGSVLWEGLSEMMESFFLRGNERNSFCWQGNAWYKQVLKNSDDAHWVGGDLFFELCNQYGFDYDDLPELFRQLDLKKGNIDVNEFVRIINNIVGADTSYLFRNAGVI